MKLLTLRSEELHLEIAPEIGGSVVRLDACRRGDMVPILRPASIELLRTQGAAHAAMHPLVPFANRVPGNLIDLVDPELRIPPNVPGEPCALHGIGWQRPWCVLDRNDQFCLLELTVDDSDWVFGFRAMQLFRLHDATLQIDITLENASSRPIPAGIGLHPYFVRTKTTTLQFRAPQVWLEGPGHIPTESVAVTSRFDFSGGRPIPNEWINNGYAMWDGSALIVDRARNFRSALTASPKLRELMIYTPGAGDYFCLEPQSHTSGSTCHARSRPPAIPLAVLAPGEQLSGALMAEVGYAEE